VFPPDEQTIAAASVDWLVFGVLQAALTGPGTLNDGYGWQTDFPNGMLAAGLDDGQPVGRLGISAYRLMRSASVPPGPERSDAARWILERGAEEVERAVRRPAG
jgi:hypothetical protein